MGTWYVASGADGGPETHYVVASRSLAPGERITRADLALAPVDLPDSLSSRAFTDADDLVDTVTLGPVGSGELLQAGAIAAVGPPDLAELSFSVEVEWAVGGDLRPGDLIDLFDTDQGTGGNDAERVLTAATILDVARPDDGLGRNRTITITVGVEPDLLPAAVRATRTGTISVVRVTGSGGSDASTDDRGADARDDDEPATDHEGEDDGS